MITVQPFCFQCLPSYFWDTWSVLHLRRTALFMFFFFDSSSLISHRLQTSQERQFAMTTDSQRLLINDCFSAYLLSRSFQTYKTFQGLQSLWFHCISGFTLPIRKIALLPDNYMVHLIFLGPEATVLRLWISQSEKLASFHSLWGPLLNRTQIS